MASAPTSIKAYTIPIDVEIDPFMEQLQLIKTPMLDLSYPGRGELNPENQARLDQLKTEAAETHLVYDLPEGAANGVHQSVYLGRYQSDISLLPDTRKRWKAEGWNGWEKRAAIAMGGYHLFYSRVEGGPLGPNEHTYGRVSGEMFLLRVSTTADEQGRRYYVDAEELGDLRKFIVKLTHLNYYGGQQVETDIRAFLLPQDGTPPHTQYITTVPKYHILPPTYMEDFSRAEKSIFLALKKKGYLSRVVSCKAEQTSRPSVETHPLPDTLPQRPDQWTEKAWNLRMTIGDDKYHMFLALADGSQRPNQTLRRHCTLWGDVLVLKVSEGVDTNGRWFYVDFDADAELPPGLLESFTKQLRVALAGMMDISVE